MGTRTPRPELYVDFGPEPTLSGVTQDLIEALGHINEAEALLAGLGYEVPEHLVEQAAEAINDTLVHFRDWRWHNRTPGQARLDHRDVESTVDSLVGEWVLLPDQRTPVAVWRLEFDPTACRPWLLHDADGETHRVEAWTVLDLVGVPDGWTWCADCGRAVEILDEGHNAGFAGEGFWWTTLACGHNSAEHGPINADTI